MYIIKYNFIEYETEQKNVKAAILDLQELIDSGEQEQYDLQQFLKNVRKYTDPEELTAEILNNLVDKIVVHAPDKSSGHSLSAAPPPYIKLRYRISAK